MSKFIYIFLFYGSQCIHSLIVYFQPITPIRAEIDVKLGGTQCNIIIGRLKPWMHLHFSKKKKMVLQEGATDPDKGATNPDKVHSSDLKAIMWTCTLSAPEMTTVLYSLSGFPLYHVSNIICLFLFCWDNGKEKNYLSSMLHTGWNISFLLSNSI